MKNKKRLMVIIVFLVLNLAIMACHIPLVSQSVGMQGDVPDIPKATQFEETEVISPTPTQTTSPNSGLKQVYYGEGIEITLPDTFVVGEVEEIEALLEEESLLNSGYAQDVEAMFQNFKDDILLWGYDTNPLNPGQTGLFIIKNEQFGGMTLMIISAFAKSVIGSQVDIVEQEIMTIGDRNVLRLLTSPAEFDLEGTQAFYIFNEDGKLWVIGFLTNSDLGQERLEGFDEAVASFKIIEGE
jgi:hypothetical protein